MKYLKKTKKSIIHLMITALCTQVITGSCVSAATTASDPLPVLKAVSHGRADINTQGTAMTITPHQSRTWIDWKSYNVAQGHQVTYQQGAGSITVNNVTGDSLSTIAGRIHVTGGSAVLINQNGLVLSDGAKIDGNMIFSTLPMNRAGFIQSGALLFEPSSSLGMIEQTGSFEAHGLSVFVGPNMSFRGDVVANLQVYAGDRVALHMSQDKLLGVDITEHVKGHAIDIKNVTGSYVRVTAAMAEKAVEGVINVTGHVHATGMETDGKGDILINGGDVTLAKTSKLTTNGGTIRIGVPQSYVAPNPTQRGLVNTLRVEKGAVLNAGTGSLFLLAQKLGWYEGHFETKGGLIELSTRNDILSNYTTSRAGGALFIDPPNLSIVDGTAGINQMSAQTIQSDLSQGPVTILNTIALGENDTDHGKITVEADASITWGSNYSLTLQAPKIDINGTIQYTGDENSMGRLNLYITGLAGNDDENAARITGTGTLDFQHGSIRTFSDNAANLVTLANTVQYTPYTLGVAQASRDIAATDYTDYRFISTRDELEGMALGGHYALKNSIDISDSVWTPIGSDGSRFTGSLTGDNFNGGYYQIQNLRIAPGGESDGDGLFRALENATIDHLGITVQEFSSPGTNTNRGPLAGYAYGGTHIFNVHTEKAEGLAQDWALQGTQQIGGLVGYAENTSANPLKIGYSSAAIDLNGTSHVGGLVGWAYTQNDGEISIRDSFATGAVTVTNHTVGGLVGLANNQGDGDLSIQNSFATGAVTGTATEAGYRVGGLVGHAWNQSSGTLSILSSYATGAVTGTGVAVGGLVGHAWNQNFGTLSILSSHAEGAVSGTNTVGGLVGEADNTNAGEISILHSYAEGTVTGTSHIGGLVGLANNTNAGEISILSSHAEGEVTGTGSSVGGLVGRAENQGTGGLSILSSYATGYVSGAAQVGGLVGLTLTLTLATGEISILHSYAEGAVTGTSYVGGLVGRAEKQGAGEISILHSYAEGVVTGANQVGGLVGRAENYSTETLSILHSYATGDVIGTGDSVAGLVGHAWNENSGTLSILNSYATGAVTGATQVGGLVGEAWNTNAGEISILRSYATGDVTGTNQVGGLVGHAWNENSGTLSITDAYSSGMLVNGGSNNIGTEQGTITKAYTIDGTEGRIDIGDLFNPTSSVATLFLGLVNSPWAVGTGEAAGRVILHLPGTAIPVVAASGSVITSVTVGNRQISPVSLNNIAHYFIPPNTAYTVTGHLVTPAPVQSATLERIGATMYQLISFPPVVTNSDGEELIAIVDESSNDTDSKETAEAGAIKKSVASVESNNPS